MSVVSTVGQCPRCGQSERYDNGSCAVCHRAKDRGRLEKMSPAERRAWRDRRNARARELDGLMRLGASLLGVDMHSGAITHQAIEEGGLLLIEQLAVALEKAASIDEIKDVLDKAGAIQFYMRKKAGGIAAAQSAGRIVTEATEGLASRATSRPRQTELYAGEESAQTNGRPARSLDGEQDLPGKVAVARAANMDPAALSRLKPLVEAKPAEKAAAVARIEARGDVVTPMALLREVAATVAGGVVTGAHSVTVVTDMRTVDPKDRAAAQQERLRSVEQLHKNGLGTNEIAEITGVSASVVSQLKSELGLLSPSVKLWGEIEHVAATLGGAMPQIERLAASAATVSLQAKQEDIESCAKRLSQISGAIRRLARSIQKKS